MRRNALWQTAWWLLCTIVLAGCQSRSFTFVQMTDPQLGFSVHKSVEEDLAHLDHAIDLINRLHPAFVVCTGDMVHDLKNDSVADIFVRHMDRLDSSIKIYYTPGNHDIHDLDSASFAFYTRHYGDPRFSFCYRGSAFVGYNSTVVQKGAGDMEQQQYVWLDSVLTKASRRHHRFVFCHIPPSPDVMDAPSCYENYPLDMRLKYMNLLRDRGVDALFCGHVHYNSNMEYEGVHVFCTNALGRPFAGERGMQVVEVTPKDYVCRYYTLNELDHKIDSINANRP